MFTTMTNRSDESLQQLQMGGGAKVSGRVRLKMKVDVTRRSGSEGKKGEAIRTDKAVDGAEPTGAINHSLHMTNTPWKTLLSCG